MPPNDCPHPYSDFKALVHTIAVYKETKSALFLDEWEQQHLCTVNAISMYLGGDLTSREQALLHRIISFTIGKKRRAWTISLANLLAGLDENGEMVAGPIGIGISTARRALKWLRKLGLVRTRRQGRGTCFCVNANGIIEHARVRFRMLEDIELGA